MVNPLDVVFVWERLMDRLTESERILVYVLGDQPMRIKEIAEAANIAAPNVSVYLGRLVDKHIIEARLSGRRTVYRLCPEMFNIKLLAKHHKHSTTH